MPPPQIIEILRNDPRYAPEAYEFIGDAVNHTQKLVGRRGDAAERDSDSHHVSGSELLKGACDFAKQEFGLLAKTVFHQWGIHRTDDIGEIVFNLIESGLLSKTDSDQRGDFQDVFDLDRALNDGFTIELDEAAWSKR